MVEKRLKSPEFDENNFEPILEWANARIVNDDGYVLVWEHGVMTFGYDEQKSRQAAALFIYLWTRGVEAGLAKHCAIGYVWP